MPPEEGGRCPGSLPIGWVVGESSPDKSIILFDSDGWRHAAVGLYVIAEGPEGCVLGMVEQIVSGSALLPEDVTDHREVEAAARYPLLHDQVYRRGVVSWLSLLDPLIRHGTPRSPTMPLNPGGRVYLAPPSYLEAVFRGGRGWVRIGTLLRSNEQVPFHVDVNKLFRHLAILAVTGGGKSNTVCVLATHIVGELGGTMVLFDMHGEYATSEDLARELGGRLKPAEPKVNPANLTYRELATLLRIPEGAHLQERIVREAWKETLSEYNEGKVTLGNLLEAFRRKVERKRRSGEATRSEREAALAVLNKFDDMMEVYGSIIDPNSQEELVDVVEPGKLTVFNLSELDEAGADAVVSHYLRRLLEERKRWRWTGGKEGYPVPILAVVEEAHILIPSEGVTLTKYWASRVAREGRKFGVGLVVVSQRPKRLDSDVLSQTNNKIILRIVEPTDQRYVREASEQLSEDLTGLLPSLNPGEAIVVGSMTRIPALVKIDRCPARTGGTDVRAVEEWSQYSMQREEERKQMIAEIQDAYGV